LRNKVLKLLTENKKYVSGEDLSSLLNISRTAVWKHIKRLRDEGYEINSSSGKGYKLINLPSQISKSAIKSSLSTGVIGSYIKILDDVDSTNNYAKKAALNGGKEGFTVISKQQNSGKGRMGRIWESPDKKGLYMSIILKPEGRVSGIKLITLMASLAVCKAINELYSINAYIKWPNDILVNSKKICGILTEAEIIGEVDTISHIILGIGVNVYQEKADFPEDIRQKATSIKLCKGTNSIIDINILCSHIIDNLNLLYENLLNNEIQTILSEYESNLGIVGNTISFIKDSNKITGKVLGIDKKWTVKNRCRQ
jgi:BirA family biotin operon repressor/biotin-[acetyl-CoA-carboxylase] ligase